MASLGTLINSNCNDGRCERVRRGEIHPVHDLTDLEENRAKSLHELVNLGSELAGGSVGCAAGLAFAGTEGAVAGSIIGTGMDTSLSILEKK